MAPVNWKKSVNGSAGTITPTLLQSCIVHKARNGEAPIDTFYTETRAIQGKFRPENYEDCEWLGSYLSLGIFSSTENYFREIFSEILFLCPSSQKMAADAQINLGSLLWHPTTDYPRGAFENFSFADAKVIVSTAKKYIKVDLETPELKADLENYDNICELRHGIVHSSRIIAGKNAIKLGIDSSKNKSCIVIKYDELQEILAICNSLVSSVNTFLFERLCQRWATDWRRLPSWRREDEHNKFKKIWSILHSSIDARQQRIPTNISMRKCKNLVKATYNIL